MYQNLLYAVKKRMLDEVELAFKDHPAFEVKVKVYNKFPYNERVQYGAILSNTSASQIRLSADNYMSELFSHVRLCRQETYPGLAIEWVRENLQNITMHMIDENVSSQLDPTLRLFRTSQQILQGPGNTEFANNIGMISVTVNGDPVLPEYVNGERRVVMLRRAPPAGAIVLVSYYYRNLALPGIYMIDFPDTIPSFMPDTGLPGPDIPNVNPNDITQAMAFYIYPNYIVHGEIVIDKTTGTETTAQLDHVGNGICNNSDFLSLFYPMSKVPQQLTRGTDYSINYTTGLVTFLLPLPTGLILVADYRWLPDSSYINGPFHFDTYQENHEVIPGIVMALGRRATRGDRQAIIVSEHRAPQAKIYGGHWTMSLEFKIIAKDPLQMAEMGDQVVNWLWGIRKNVLEYEGITLNSVEPSGETEEVHIETTGDQYFETSIAINVQTEWQEFRPYLFDIREIIPDMKVFPGIQDYSVSGDGSQVEFSKLKSDNRPVIKYPIIGYEKVE